MQLRSRMKMISMVSSNDLFLRRWRKTMRWTDLTSVNSLQRRPRFSRTKIFSNKISKPKNIDMLQVRSNKAEEEVAELMKKSTQLESELDKTKEELV